MTDYLKLSEVQLRKDCPPDQFSFQSTAEVEPLKEVIGQDRAVRSIEFGVHVSGPGFNLFLAGQPGTGKTTILKRTLEPMIAERPVPDDFFYVHNFDDPDCPRVLTLPAGKGKRFRDDMREFVTDLQESIPKAFEGKEYEEQQRRTAESYQKRKQELIERLEEGAAEHSFQIKSTPTGFRTIPHRGDKPLTQEEYQELDKAEREKLDAAMEELQGEIRNVMSEVKDVDQQLKEELRELNRQVAMNVLGSFMGTLRKRYKEAPPVLEHLDKVQQDVIDNIELFRAQEEQQLPIPGLKIPRQEPDLTRYAVNLVVDNAQQNVAPIVIETNPTYNNLVGRIERRAQFGALLTDFTMIRAGSLAKANGGFLVLNIEDVLRNPFVYEALKRALTHKEARIEDLAERFGLFSAQTLRPEPIPLNVKVCLIGNPLYYHLLFAYDQDFREIFKVKADFDFQADRSDRAIAKFGAFVARLVKEEELPDFDRTAVAAIVEESSRFVEDQEKISLRFAQVNDLIREAAYWARQDKVETVTSKHVERAVEEAEYRSSLSRERVQEMIQREILMIDTEGERVGQINGLAVHMLGDYLFGRPTRITAAVYMGREGVINIERRAQMSHGTHDKGVLILAGFLGGRFAQEKPLALTASLTFEQSYGQIAGDSASSTELYVLLSAIASVPIKQGIAVTGSVNQRGEVQPIGGVNYKIEGFFDVCSRRGLTGSQGVIIPRANVQHLMVRRPILEAVKAGKFHVWAIDHVDEGIEILTGMAAGESNEKGEWPEGSLNHRVDERLLGLGAGLQEWGRGVSETAPEVVGPKVEPAPEPPPPPKPPDRPQENR